jgi:hypothetical protein
MVADVESSRTASTSSGVGSSVVVENPYRDLPSSEFPSHPFNILQRVIYMGISAYGLHHLKLYASILHSPRIDHDYLKVGLAIAVGM